MPYKFGEYVSTYVDPQSVAISETLRNRFTENFKANDNLTMAVEQMKAALPFENDVAKKKELEGKINETLETLSTRGDYENLGFAVHRAAKDFSTGYAPIKENYDRYQNALKDLDEQYKKGDINAEDYNDATSYITKGYKGFEIDPATGKVKEGTMYSSPTIYKDPKLMDKMKERLEILYEKTSSGKTTTAGLDANGVWKVTSGEKTVEIPEADVMAVYNAVIEEPDVRMYLDQRADMKLYKVEKSGNTGQYLDAKMQTNSSAIQQLNEAMASGKYSAADKKILATQIDALSKENEKLTAAKADPELASSYLKDQFRKDLLDPVREYAMKKAGVREHSTEYSYENNFAIQLDAMRRKADAEAAMGVSFYEAGDVTAADDISGKTANDKRTYLTGIDQQIAALEKEIADNKGTMSPDMLSTKQAALNANINERSRVQGQLTAAADKAIKMSDLEKQDSKLIATFRQMMPGATAGQIYQQMQRTFDNAGDQDYIDFQTVFDKQNGAGSFAKHMNQNYVPATTGIQSGYAPMGATSWATQDMTQAQRDAYFSAPTGTPGMVLNKFNGVLDLKVSNTFPEIKTSTLFNAGTIDVGDPAKSVALTKIKDAYFNGKMPFENQMFTVNGQQKSGKQLAAEGYVIKNAYPDIQTNMYQIHLEKGGDKPGSITAIYDGRQVDSPELRAAMSDPEIRLGSLIAQHDTRVSGATSTIKTVTLNGKPVDMNVISQGDGNPIITFTKPGTNEDVFTGGTPTKLTANDAQIKNAIAKEWLKF
jgi:hypothetical protein